MRPHTTKTGAARKHHGKAFPEAIVIFDHRDFDRRRVSTHHSSVAVSRRFKTNQTTTAIPQSGERSRLWRAELVEAGGEVCGLSVDEMTEGGAVVGRGPEVVPN